MFWFLFFRHLVDCDVVLTPDLHGCLVFAGVGGNTEYLYVRYICRTDIGRINACRTQDLESLENGCIACVRVDRLVGHVGERGESNIHTILIA